MAMDMSPRTYRYLPADVLLAAYRVVGKVMVSTTGTIGLLNDPTRSVLEIQDARMARIHTPTKIVDHFELVRLMKAHVLAVCMARREDLGPQALVRGGFASIVDYPVRLTLQSLEIEGHMELPGRFDVPALTSDGTREFLPIFNVVLTGIQVPTLRIESGGILINRRHIDTLALTAQRAKEDR